MLGHGVVSPGRSHGRSSVVGQFEPAVGHLTDNSARRMLAARRLARSSKKMPAKRTRPKAARRPAVQPPARSAPPPGEPEAQWIETLRTLLTEVEAAQAEAERLMAEATGQLRRHQRSTRTTERRRTPRTKADS